MFDTTRRSTPVALVAGLAACGVLAGCGGSSGGTGAASGGAKASPTSSASSTASAVAEVRADWTAFFSGTTPAQRKIALLQNGQTFAALITAQARSPMATSSSAKVLSVALTGSSSAKVGYSILLAGKPALSNQSGTAVLQGGTWKVGDASFCSLLALQNGGKAPAPCPTA